MEKNRVDINDFKYIKMGLIVILFVFGIFGIWAATAKIDSGVPLGGQVVVESDNKIVQHLEGGIVEKIYVKDGDFVNKGDLLIKFDETKAKSSLHSLEAQYYETLALQARLTAENKGKKEIIFPDELELLGAQKAAFLKNAQLEILQNAQSSLMNEKIVSEQKIASMKKHIESLKATIGSKEVLLSSYQDEAKEQEELYEERLIDKTRLREIQRKIETLESDISTNRADITKTQIQISELETQYLLLKEEYFSNVKKQLREVQVSLEDLKAKIIEVKDRLSRSYVKAPESGTVLELNVHTVGAVVSSGNPIMKIVPEDSKLIIKAMLSPEYIDYVKIGLKANMNFPAFKLKSSFIKNIQGEVVFVAADSSKDDKGNQFYIVKLIIDEEGKKTLEEEEMVLQAGMPVSVVVKIGQQTTLEYLVRPITTMLHRAFLEE